mmetsp:Transcript_27613/g.66372  ORF Transcript_27613/g.66372 Transcript_27613/m.66372 type:complete len:359 (+) Transcript_27613:1217-2293(+)
MWCQFLQTHFPGEQPNLQGVPHGKATELLVTFAGHVRSNSNDSPRKPVRAQTVSVALSAVSKTIHLAGQPPLLGRASGQAWPVRIQQLLEGYHREDPPPRSQLALPVKVLEHLHHQSRAQPASLQAAQSDLCIIAFFFLLRVGEYTYHNPKQRRRTTQFRLKDIKLWSGDQLLDTSLPQDELLRRCTAATLTIDNQKNGKRGSVIHHEATASPICPIKAIIRRVTNITSSPNHTPDTIIGTHFNTKHPTGYTVNARQITATLRKAAKTLNLERQGIPAELISSHSLRAGGATALHLNGYDTKTIQILGRWSSDTFLTYIHHQIAAFSTGLSTAMANNIPFHNTQHTVVRPSVGDIVLP